MELYKAHQQWATRPNDERFETVKALYDATKAYYSDARQKEVPFSDIRVEANDKDVQLVGKLGIPAKLTNWSFGQVASLVGAPASYLRTLPATLASQNLNHGLAKRLSDSAKNSIANLLFHKNGGLVLRAINTQDYERLWNWEVAERLLDLAGQGWEVARPDIRVIINHKPGCPSQVDNSPCNCPQNLPLYASDHDMFAFLRNPNLTVDEKGSSGAVYRGLMVSNSEVGAAVFNLTGFLYREMCGNHIVWGASDVLDLRFRHVGTIRDRVNLAVAQVRKYAESSVSDLEAKIAIAKSKVIAGTKEEVLDAIFGKRSLKLARKTIEAGYDAVNEAEDGPANTSWGLVQGLTRHSQTIPFADERTKIDSEAGKILDFDF